MAGIGFQSHDHAACISAGIASAAAACARAGLRFTPVRRRVLEILLREHRAMGAYDILEYLRDEGLGSQPPVAYRALDFLVKNGFAHKVERLNAFIACTHPDGQSGAGHNTGHSAGHNPVFLICRKCDAVAEATWQPLQGQLGQAAAEMGFAIEACMVEAEGICPNCASKAGG